MTSSDYRSLAPSAKFWLIFLQIDYGSKREKKSSINNSQTIWKFLVLKIFTSRERMSNQASIQCLIKFHENCGLYVVQRRNHCTRQKEK